VKVALQLGSDINGHADFSQYRIEVDGRYLLLNYPGGCKTRLGWTSTDAS